MDPGIALRRRLFGFVAATCCTYFVLTIVAMLLYPGGSVAHPESESYSFFLNFFSDLGQTHVGYGSNASNLASMLLFAIALITTAIALTLFFVLFCTLFVPKTKALWLARAAAICSVVTCISFIGVALTPWNLFLQAHNWFVMWAFRSLLLAMVLLIVALLLEPSLPRKFVAVFGVFALILVAYVALLTFGPPSASPAGSIVQATGQKIIAYASIVTVLIQSLAARQWLARGVVPR